MRTLPHDRAVRDLEAAYDYLAARPEVDKSRIGSIGWCMGGGYSLQLAIHEPKLTACVVNYGAMPTDPADIARSKRPSSGILAPTTGASHRMRSTPSRAR